MRPARLLLAALLLLSAVASRASAEEDRGPVRLDPKAEAAVVDYARGVTDDILGALRGEADARDALQERAAKPSSYLDELVRFDRATREEGTVVGVAPAGFDVDATLWYGFVPMGAAQLHFYLDEEGARLVRLRGHAPDASVFGSPRGPEWKGDAGEAFGVLARDILDAVVQGRCDALPVLAVAPEGSLPEDPEVAARVRRNLRRMQQQSERACRALTGHVFDRLVWRVGSLSGVVVLADGRRLPFEQALVAGPDGRVRLGHLSPPRR
ncbi:MAG: hypothetical protein ACQEXJ_22740 [Myxococcota bacterium]